MAKLFESIGKLGLALAVGGGIVNSALFNGGCYSVTHYLQLLLFIISPVLIQNKFCWILYFKRPYLGELEVPAHSLFQQ